jgi:hypothetical protein
MFHAMLIGKSRQANHSHSSTSGRQPQQQDQIEKRVREQKQCRDQDGRPEGLQQARLDGHIARPGVDRVGELNIATVQKVQRCLLEPSGHRRPF